MESVKNCIIGIISKPVRTLIVATGAVNDPFSDVTARARQVVTMKLTGQENVEKKILDPKREGVKAASRVVLVAAIAFSCAELGMSASIAVPLVALISAPAALIGVGTYVVSLGIVAVITGLAHMSLGNIMIGVMTYAAGQCILEAHDWVEIGILESYVFQPLATALVPEQKIS